MKDNKEIRKIKSEEEKDISGGMTENSNISNNIIKTNMLAYGGPFITPINPLTEVIKKTTESKSTVKEFIPSSSENQKTNDK